MIQEKGAQSLNDNRGWIKLHRKTVDTDIWPGNEGRRFTRFEAWLDILLRASYKDHMCYDIPVKRGQVLTSQVKLAICWGWDSKTVRKFLKTLKKNSTIGTTTTNKFTLITICNYDRYQSSLSDEESNTPHQIPYQSPHQIPHQAPNNQEVKNIKKYIASSRKRETPNTDHGKAVDYWNEKYLKRFETSYLFKGARDGKAVKNLLTNFGFTMYCKLVDEFLNSDDEWVAKHDKFDLAMLESKANELSQRLSGNGSTSLMAAPNGGFSDIVPH